jgi:hypothetical protein
MLRQLRSAGIQRGVLGGSVPWMATAAVLWGARGIAWAMRRNTGRVWRGSLGDGETLVITSRRGSARARGSG